MNASRLLVYRGFFKFQTKCYSHSDVVFPNFDEYRAKSTLDPNKPALETEDERRALPNALYYGGL